MSNFVDLTASEDEDEGAAKAAVAEIEGPRRPAKEQPAGFNFFPEFFDFSPDIGTTTCNNRHATKPRCGKETTKSSAPIRRRKAPTGHNGKGQAEGGQPTQRKRRSCPCERNDTHKVSKVAKLGKTAEGEGEQSNPRYRAVARQQRESDENGDVSHVFRSIFPDFDRPPGARKAQGVNNKRKAAGSNKVTKAKDGAVKVSRGKAESNKNKAAKSRKTANAEDGAAQPPAKHMATQPPKAKAGNKAKAVSSKKAANAKDMATDTLKSRARSTKVASRNKAANQDDLPNIGTSSSKASKSSSRKGTSTSSGSKKKSAAAKTKTKSKQAKSSSKKGGKCSGEDTIDHDEETIGHDEEYEDDPVGVDICVDVVDICDGDDIEEGMLAQDTAYECNNEAFDAFFAQFQQQEGLVNSDDSQSATFSPLNPSSEKTTSQAPMKGIGMTLPLKASALAEEEEATNHLAGKEAERKLRAKASILLEDETPKPQAPTRGTGMALPLKPSVQSDKDADDQTSTRSSIIRDVHVETLQNGANEELFSQEMESPVGVNICVDVDDLFLDDDGEDVPSLPTVGRGSSADIGDAPLQGQKGVKSQGVRKVSVSEDTDAREDGPSKANILLQGPSWTRNSDHREEGSSKTSSHPPSFRPNKPTIRGTKIQPPKKQSSFEKKPPKLTSTNAAPSPCRNFVFVDNGGHDSDDDFCYVTDVKPGRKPIHQMKPRTSSAKTCRPGSHYESYYIPNHKQPESLDDKKAKAPTNTNYTTMGFSSQEAAAEVQDRLLNEAAKRMRKKVEEDPNFYRPVPADESLSFAVPFPDVYKHHPEHWQWRDPYARLGLPHMSSVALVKKHYRKLALVYHPDKLKPGDSPQKFHAITAAYRKLTG